MASGGKEMVTNTQERAISTDQNRSQKFANADRAEAWRYLLNVAAGTDDLDGNGFMTQFSTQGTPLDGEILNGLCVKPQVGAGVFDLFVDSGVAMVLDPDAAPDDSNYKYVRDPGISTLGVLTMTTNVSGSTRIDIIECQDANNVVETDNRDIFNPATGLFTPTTVTKARASNMVYRVRLGTPGSGFPGVVQGWLPLAVASVPTGTTTNDNITFWDVRPLVGDRRFGPVNTSRDFPIIDQQLFKVDINSSVGKSLLTGVISATTTTGRRLGGRMRRSSPDLAASVESVDLRDVNNQQAGGLANNNAFYYVYLLDLVSAVPRWARYTNAADGLRKPRSPRGILIASDVVPNHYYGTPSSGITLPASWGLGASSFTTGVCVAVGIKAAGVPQGIVCDGKSQFAEGGGAPVAATSITSTTSFFTLIDGTTHPANAKAIWILFTAVFNVGANTHVYSFGGGNDVYVFPGVQASLTNPLAVVSAQPLTNFVGNGSAITGLNVAGYVKVPIASAYPTLAGPNKTVAWLTQLFDVTGSTNITPTSATMSILGWDL
jgi:hypothetical protein